MKKNIELFEIIRKLNFKPTITQRTLAKELGFSLGKLNYCLKALNQKGLIKINSFKNRTNKLDYFRQYILTPKGIKYRIDLTAKYMKKKMEEYDQLKREISNRNSKIDEKN